MTPDDLLRALADGTAQSGQALAEQFGVTRAAVWKHTERLKRWGLTLEAIPGQGYRLTEPVDLIDSVSLEALLGDATRASLERVEVFTEIDSTNAHVAAHPPSGPGRLVVCLAEYQSAGRGRRGRQWHTPLGAGLCLSAGFTFAETPPDLGALTLAAGVAVRRAVARVTGCRVALKWPNDLVWRDAKLGGILVELAAESQGNCTVVLGLGLNVPVPRDVLAKLSDWAGGAVDLETAAGGCRPGRARLAAAVIDEWAALLAVFARSGFGPYRDEWQSADYLRDRPVRVSDSTGALEGRACGIDADGALLVATGGGARRRIIAGDVSVRFPS